MTQHVMLACSAKDGLSLDTKRDSWRSSWSLRREQREDHEGSLRMSGSGGGV